MKEEVKVVPVRVEQQFDTDSSTQYGGSKKSSTSSIGKDEEDEVAPRLHAKTFLIIFTVALMYFTQVVSIVGTGSLTPAIDKVFDNSTHGVWLSASITTLTVVLGLPISQAADLWGRRWFLIILTLFGAAGSTIVARATSINMAIAGEVVSGLAFGVQPLLHAIMSEVVPRKWRPYGQAASTVACGLGGLAGLLMAGVMTRNENYEGFRNFQHTTTGLWALSVILCYFVYTPPVRLSQMGLSNAEKLRKLDWIGYVLFFSGLVTFSMGLSWSMNPFSWTDAHVTATLAIGLALMACTAIYEMRFKKDGMFHHGLFSKGWNFVIALECIFIDGTAYIAMNSYFSFQVNVLYEPDPLRANLRYGVGYIVCTIVACIGGFFCSRTKTIRIPLMFAFSVMTVFFICMATTTTGSSTAVWVYPILFGTGLGISLGATMSVAQLSTPKELLTITTGLMISIRAFGGSIALAFFNAIFRAKVGDNLEPMVMKAVLPLGMPSSSIPALMAGLTYNNATALSNVPGADPEIIAAGFAGMRSAYVLGFRYVWVAAACLTALAAISSSLIVNPTKEFNMKIDAPAEEYHDLFDD